MIREEPARHDIAEFNENAADMMRRVRRTRTPIVLTQKGKQAAVVLGPDEYRRMKAAVELAESMRRVRASMRQHAAGRARPADEALADLEAKWKAATAR